MYNIQDWIDEKIELDPIEATLDEWGKGSVEAAYEKGLLNERLKNEIKKKQEWTYDKAVELAFQYEKKKWEDIVANCDPNDLSKIVEDDIENLNRKLYSPLTQFDLDNPYFDNNAELISEIKKGIKYTKHIKGGEYKKVEAEYKKFKNNESFQKVNLEYGYNYYYLSYKLKLKKFLEEIKSNLPNDTREKEDEIKNIFNKEFGTTKVFKKNEDLDSFINTLANYFVNGIHNTPSEIIETKPGNKKRLRRALANVQRNFKDHSYKLSQDTKFAQIAKQIDIFKDYEPKQLLEKISKMEK